MDAAGRPGSHRAGLSDLRLIGGVADITAMIAGQLDDGASAGEVIARHPGNRAPVARAAGTRRGATRIGVWDASTCGTLVRDLRRVLPTIRVEDGTQRLLVI